MAINISLAQKWSITTEYPRELITEVLLEREDLVDPDTLSLVESSDLPKFLGPDWSNSSFWIVVNEMLRRDLGDLEDTMLSRRPEVFFQSGVKAFCEDRLHQSWSDRIYSHSSVILSGNWLQQLDSTKELAVALSILRYPRNLAKNSAEISKRLSEIRDDAVGDGRTTMQAALLRSAIDDGSAQSWSLISLVLPELRVVIVSGKLPRSAESILSNDLPDFYSVGHWDINKRILLSLSKLNNFAPNNVVLATLGLNPEEMELVLDDHEYSAKKLSRKFWPWLY